MSNLGDRIKDLRKQKNLSQSELADKVGISYAQIGRYETKGAQPPAETLKLIADALGVSPDFLIYGTSDLLFQHLCGGLGGRCGGPLKQWTRKTRT
jgi:transcriptional regulator with XRE-family HTH domain